MQAPHSFAARNAEIGWQLLEASHDRDSTKYAAAVESLRTLIDQVSAFCAHLDSPRTPEDSSPYARSVRRLMVLDETQDLTRLKDKVCSEAEGLSHTVKTVSDMDGLQSNDELKALKLGVASFSRTLADFNL